MRLDLPSADQNQHEVNSGVAGEYWIGLDDRYFVSLGARHDWNGRFADSTTWRATVSARATDTVRLHASAGTGVKNPDFYELFGFFPAPAFVGNPGLKPEKSFGWDAGIEWRPRDGVVIDATYFHADLEDEIFTDFSVFPNTARNASGQQRARRALKWRRAPIWAAVSLSTRRTPISTRKKATARQKSAGRITSPRRTSIGDFADGRAHLNLGADYHGEPARHRVPERAAVFDAGDARFVHAGAHRGFVRCDRQHRLVPRESRTRSTRTTRRCSAIAPAASACSPASGRGSD